MLSLACATPQLSLVRVSFYKRYRPIHTRSPFRQLLVQRRAREEVGTNRGGRGRCWGCDRGRKGSTRRGEKDYRKMMWVYLPRPIDAVLLYTNNSSRMLIQIHHTNLRFTKIHHQRQHSSFSFHYSEPVPAVRTSPQP